MYDRAIRPIVDKCWRTPRARLQTMFVAVMVICWFNEGVGGWCAILLFGWLTLRLLAWMVRTSSRTQTQPKQQGFEVLLKGPKDAASAPANLGSQFESK